MELKTRKEMDAAYQWDLSPIFPDQAAWEKAYAAAAQAVDAAIAALGLVRTGCSDVPDPSGMRHKQMRYEGIIDMDSDIVYWNGNNY